MVRKYRPALEYDEYSGRYGISSDPDATMKEDKYGEWIKLKTFVDSTALLNSQISRLKREVKILQSKLNEN